MDIMGDQYETAVEGWLDAELLTESEPLDDDVVWFSMRRIGYDADAIASIRGDAEPEFRWFG